MFNDIFSHLDSGYNTRTWQTNGQTPAESKDRANNARPCAILMESPVAKDIYLGILRY